MQIYVYFYPFIHNDLHVRRWNMFQFNFILILFWETLKPAGLIYMLIFNLTWSLFINCIPEIDFKITITLNLIKIYTFFLI